MTKIIKKLKLAFKCCAVLFITSFLSAQSIVEQHGRLRVNGNHVVNKDNETVSLAGNSLFWSNFSEGAKFYNAETVNHLASEWKTDIVRAAMGVEDSGGYISNPEREKNKVKAVVEASINAGVYIIIDWHSHNAEQYQSQAIAFFTEMAELYGNNDHVIYEVYNEPIGQSWTTVKSYAEAVIAAIRSKDPDNLIIVGSPQWSQKVVDASSNPISDINTAYTLHFYAGTHKQSLRNDATTAMNNGIALFVTEWGAVNANGDGVADKQETQLWLDFMKDNSISHANWSVSDKAEGASVVASNAGVAGLLSNNLSTTGVYIKDIIENWNTTGGTPPAPQVCEGKGVSINNIIQAEDYCQQFGTIKEPTTDAGGGSNMGYIDDGDYLRYRINIPTNGTYVIKCRVASEFATGKIQFKVDSSNLGSISVPNTGNWQSWTTVEEEVNFNAGDQTLELSATSGKFNINWFEINEANNNSNPPPVNNTCDFNTPQTSPLQTFSGTYNHAHILGNTNLNLSNITNFSINWNLENNGLYQLSMNSNDGNPNWWIDLKNSSTHNFSSVKPSVTFTGTSIANFDGTYWVTIDSNNFVMKSTTTDTLIYFSNDPNQPNCGDTSSKQLQTKTLNKFAIYPNPVENVMHIKGLADSESNIKIYSLAGKLISKNSLGLSSKLDVSYLPSGYYILKVTSRNDITAIKFIKQ
ncbi:hypothetical protein MHTCC0001_20100 [Flavobacteriaceae bacterium MHTCC 0001]